MHAAQPSTQSHPSTRSDAAPRHALEAEIERIRLLVLHADPVVHAGLAFACGNCADFELHDLPAAQDGAIGLPTFPQACTADIVVADYAHGVTLAASAVRGPAGSLKVLVVGGSDREWDIRRALAHGVRGYLLAGCTLEEVAAAIRAVSRGARHLSPRAAARLAESVYCEPLTGREEEVLRLVAHGLPNKTVANRLGISVGTVKSHLKSTFEKLNVRSRTQAVALVEERGLLAVVE